MRRLGIGRCGGGRHEIRHVLQLRQGQHPCPPPHAPGRPHPRRPAGHGQAGGDALLFPRGHPRHAAQIRAGAGPAAAAVPLRRGGLPHRAGGRPAPGPGPGGGGGRLWRHRPGGQPGLGGGPVPGHRAGPLRPPVAEGPGGLRGRAAPAGLPLPHQEREQHPAAGGPAGPGPGPGGGGGHQGGGRGPLRGERGIPYPGGGRAGVSRPAGLSDRGDPVRAPAGGRFFEWSGTAARLPSAGGRTAPARWRSSPGSGGRRRGCS